MRLRTLLIDVIASGLPTNQPDEFAGRWAQKLGPVFGPLFETGRERDPGAEWYAFAMLSGKSFETLDASILGPSDFVPKLTLCETSRGAFRNASKVEPQESCIHPVLSHT